MGNPLRGETSFEVDGKTFQVKFDWNAAAEYEDAAGEPISGLLGDLANDRTSAKSMRAMLWAGLRAHHAELTIQDVGRLIDKLGRVGAQRVMGHGLRYWYPELSAEEAESADPPTPASSP